MAIKNFRKGETTYTCQCCKKLTRNTGGDEIHCRLCEDCYELAGIENYLTDNGEKSTMDEYGDEIKSRLTRRPELIAHYKELAALIGK